MKDFAERVGVEVVERPGLPYGELRWRGASGRWNAVPARESDRKMWDAVRALVMTRAAVVPRPRTPEGFDVLPGLEVRREGS